MACFLGRPGWCPPRKGSSIMKKLVAVATVFVCTVSIFEVRDVSAQVGLVASLQARDSSREPAQVDVPVIFDVRKSLPMEPDEPSYHDFYINAGSEVGLKKGQYVPVQRALPVHDPVQNKQQAILTVPVGRILVIHVERNMAVARLVTELGDEERPTLEYESIMIGDRIDMKGITTDAPKNVKLRKKKIAARQGSRESEVFAAAGTSANTSADAGVPASLEPLVTDSPQAAEPVKSVPKSAPETPPSSPPRVTQTLPAPTA